MKTRIINIRKLYLALLLAICYQIPGITQEITSTPKSQSNFFIGLSIGPNQSQIINNGTSSISKLHSTKKSKTSGSLEFGFMFSRLIGVTTGLGYSSYGSELSLDSCASKASLTDSDHEAYQHSVKGSGIKELQQISFLNVPACLLFQVPITNKFGFFLHAGVSFSFPLSKTYKSSGTFTYTNYYPAYNVLLKDIPTYGLVSNAKINSDGNLELKTASIFALADAGLQYFVSSKIQIGLGVSYDRSLSNISNYGSPGSFEISPSPTQINSMMGGSDKATTQSIGVKISLRYYLK